MVLGIWGLYDCGLRSGGIEANQVTMELGMASIHNLRMGADPHRWRQMRAEAGRHTFDDLRLVDLPVIGAASLHPEACD